LGVPHLATCTFLIFYNEPELGAVIDSGMALTPFPYSILEETRFKPTTFWSWVELVNHQTRLTPWSIFFYLKVCCCYICFYNQLMFGLMYENCLNLQSNLVITNSTGPRKYVRNNREIVITVKVYVVNAPFGSRKVELYLFVIAMNSL